jgi:hypothetical protein
MRIWLCAAVALPAPVAISCGGPQPHDTGQYAAVGTRTAQGGGRGDSGDLPTARVPLSGAGVIK